MDFIVSLGPPRNIKNYQEIHDLIDLMPVCVCVAYINRPFDAPRNVFPLR